jgi:hypothetical protein
MVLEEVVKLHWNALNKGPPGSGKTTLECIKQWYSKKW